MPDISERNTYRLVLVSSESRACLMADDHGLFRLPRLSLPMWTRLADQATRVLRDSFGVSAIVLDILASDSPDAGCILAEHLGETSAEELSKKGIWKPILDLSPGEFNEPEQKAIERLLETGNTGRGVFSRLGWIEDAIRWIRSEIPDATFHFNGELHQLNANGVFALVRFGNAHGKDYWFKAVGEPNLHELKVTRALSQMFSRYLPKFIAERPEWNGWITEDAGTRLTEPAERHEVDQAVSCLAELQIASLDMEEQLLSAGCFDQRLDVLQEHVSSLVEVLVIAMSKQTSTKAPRITEKRIREIGSILIDSSSAMAALKLPHTIIHNDFGFGNVLFDGTACVVTDWAEACVGIPTFTYEHFRHRLKVSSHSSLWLQELDDAYKRSWREIVGEDRIEKALVIGPLLALASHLYGRGTWLHTPERETPRLERYARTIARYMDSAAASSRLLEAI